jgi:hypothetical protein
MNVETIAKKVGKVFPIMEVVPGDASTDDMIKLTEWVHISVNPVDKYTCAVMEDPTDGGFVFGAPRKLNDIKTLIEDIKEKIADSTGVSLAEKVKDAVEVAPAAKVAKAKKPAKAKKVAKGKAKVAKVVASKTLAKLNKTSASLSAFVGRNGRLKTGKRGFQLVDRYSELADLAVAEGVWAEYCESKKFSIDHTAYDYFA